MSKISGQHMIKFLFSIAVALMASGCSAYMAASRDPGKDISVLRIGAVRAQVVGSLGRPVISDTVDGRKIDVFSFQDGYKGSSNAGRAIFHVGADIVTGGLWEIVGTPTEALLQGQSKVIKVKYDAEEKVNEILVYKGNN